MAKQFLIKYSDIDDLMWAFKNNLSEFRDELESEKSSLRKLISDTGFTGESAESIQRYYQEVHVNLLVFFETLAQTLLDTVLAYKTGYRSFDTATNFILPKESMQDFKRNLSNCLDYAENSYDSAKSAIRSVSDLISLPVPQFGPLENAHRDIDRNVSDLIHNIESYEEETARGISNTIRTFLDQIRAGINSVYSGKLSVTEYTPGKFFSNNYVIQALIMSETLQGIHDENKDTLNRLWEAEEEIKVAAEKRKEEGIWKTVGGVGLVVLGAVCIVATAGAATPVVAGIGVAAGAGTAAFGVAEGIEGAQEIYYGSTGDIDSKSLNILRDTLFLGNQEAYQVTESIFAFTASAMIPIGAAEQAGALTIRSGAVTVGKVAVSEYAGKEASKFTYEATDNRVLSMLAGAGVSALTGAGLEMLDKKLYISHPNHMEVSNPDYLTPDGKIDWDKYAPNNGVEAGTLKPNRTLAEETIIDRYGPEYGTYSSPKGTIFDERSLPYRNNPNMHYTYKVVKKIEGVKESQIAPAFGRPGGGIQYQLPKSIEVLVDEGYLIRIIPANEIITQGVISAGGETLINGMLYE